MPQRSENKMTTWKINEQHWSNIFVNHAIKKGTCIYNNFQNSQYKDNPALK